MSEVLECDGPSGLVLLDAAVMSRLTDEEMGVLDILLDTQGVTELSFDFPGRDWQSVWKEETGTVRDACRKGAMVILLMDGSQDYEVDFAIDTGSASAPSSPPLHLHLESGKLVGISASELIQVVSFPRLEPTLVIEEVLEPGWYGCKPVLGEPDQLAIHLYPLADGQESREMENILDLSS